MFQGPVIYKDYVIYRCVSCKGSGAITSLPESGPPHEDLCEACGGVGLVKIAIADLKQMYVTDV